jgi:hypothetical protein
MMILVLQGASLGISSRMVTREEPAGHLLGKVTRLRGGVLVDTKLPLELIARELTRQH